MDHDTQRELTALRGVINALHRGQARSSTLAVLAFLFSCLALALLLLWPAACR